MKISSRCEYACRSILELALHGTSETPLTAFTIADRRGIPEKYLVHILLQLKNAGLVRSIRGAQGGYLLAHAPADISLLDIVEAIDGPVLSPLPSNDHSTNGLDGTWKHVADDIREVLRQYTGEDLVAGVQHTCMYYI